MGKKPQQILSPTQKNERYRKIEILQLKRTLASTPAQRLAWLEEALEFAYKAGALPLITNRGRFTTSNTE